MKHRFGFRVSVSRVDIMTRRRCRGSGSRPGVTVKDGIGFQSGIFRVSIIRQRRRRGSGSRPKIAGN